MFPLFFRAYSKLQKIDLTKVFNNKPKQFSRYIIFILKKYFILINDGRF